MFFIHPAFLVGHNHPYTIVMPDCGVGDPSIKSNRGQLCLYRKSHCDIPYNLEHFTIMYHHYTNVMDIIS